jgi:hypothetical protein
LQLPATRRSRRSLAAAATRVTASNAGAYTRRLAMPWQTRALFYSLSIGELNYASNFYSRMLQRLKIYPATRHSDDSITPIDTGAPVDLLNRIQDPGGGRTAILGKYGRLMMVTGEGYLFGRGIDTGDPETWSFVWREELRFDDDGVVTHVLSPNVPYENYELTDATYEEIPSGSAVAYRMWTPNPRFSGWPTSPFQAILEEAEELLVLSRSVLATATSRLVRSPLLIVPEEIAPAPITPLGDEDPLNDPFLRQFVAHLEAAIDDPAAAGSLAPYVLYAASEWADKIKPIWLHNTDTDYMERDLRTECIRRIARGLDLPPEVVEGMSDANHWAAWWISDDMWRSHGAPIAEQFCDDLSEAYLRPALREIGYEDWRDVVVAYDASAVVVNPDRSKDADQAWDRGAINYNAYRTAKNFNASDAQTDEEHAEWLAIKKVILAPDGTPLPDTGAGAGIPAAKAVETGDNPGDQPGAPAGQPGPVSESTGLPASAAKFQGAAELALLRCRELAGSRIRSRRKSCPHCLDGVAHLPNPLVASGLGRAGLEPLGSPEPRDLVAGGTDSLKALLLSWGYDEKDADTVCGFIELHAARTLFTANPQIPESFHAVS